MEKTEIIKITDFRAGDAYDCDDVCITTEGNGKINQWIFQSIKGKDCNDCETYLNNDTFDIENLSDIDKQHYTVACEKFDNDAMSLFY